MESLRLTIMGNGTDANHRQDNGLHRTSLRGKRTQYCFVGCYFICSVRHPIYHRQVAWSALRRYDCRRTVTCTKELCNGYMDGLPVLGSVMFSRTGFLFDLDEYFQLLAIMVLSAPQDTERGHRTCFLERVTDSKVEGHIITPRQPVTNCTPHFVSIIFIQARRVIQLHTEIDTEQQNTEV